MTDETLVFLFAAFTFILTAIWGGPLIKILGMLKIGDKIRLELPDRYIEKAGKPTMGGIMFIIPTIIISVFVNAGALIGGRGTGRSILIVIGTMVLFGFLGAIDDWQKLRQKVSGEGMRSRYKFLLQLVFALVIGFGLYAVLDVPQFFLPGVSIEIELGWLYVPIAAFVIVSSANAVNFTDGLDGFAGLISATCFAVYGIIALLQGQIFLAQFCFILVGAVFGFLWYNVHPAQLIMGDTGSMALGSALGVVALMSGHWILLPLIAIIPVSEVLSVIIQVGYFKLTKGKRIFKMSPLHLHFELSGWSETQIVQRFWLLTLLTALIGIALASV